MAATLKLPVPEINAVEAAFPANALRWMPPRDEIPAEYAWQRGSAETCAIANQWFMHGLPAGAAFEPREGVNPNQAITAIKATLGSFAPKHEHKIEAVAYMLDCWFERIEGWKR